jgi:hypothetical protein
MTTTSDGEICLEEAEEGIKQSLDSRESKKVKSMSSNESGERKEKEIE